MPSELCVLAALLRALKDSFTLVAHMDANGNRMATMMRALIALTRFKPARCSGVPCAKPFPFEYFRREG
jgi:hypothetical protein